MSEARDSRVIAENQRQAARLSSLGWYHSIELPDGTVIKGHQSLEQLRRRLAQFSIPADLSGRRVLDIGAWDGWFSFEMEKRGADVVALDSTKNTRLAEAKKLLGSRIECVAGDICRITEKDLGTFDIVLFLGVLYHLKHPLLALENVCGMCRDRACIESFVSDGDTASVPSMEFYETAELRGQLDNWTGPNLPCLMAFCRTAGFARVELNGLLGERAHVTGFRHWDGKREAAGASAPEVLCVDNAATHDHNFSAWSDDYLTFYFLWPGGELCCDNVLPQVGPFGSRPIYVASTGEGWIATCKIPPGLPPGWHDASLCIADGARSRPLRIGVDIWADERAAWPSDVTHSFRIASIADGKSFEAGRVRVGPDTAITVWSEGLASFRDLRVRLNGCDLPAAWQDAATGQINALLPSGLAAGRARASIVCEDGRESEPVEFELVRV